MLQKVHSLFQSDNDEQLDQDHLYGRVCILRLRLHAVRLRDQLVHQELRVQPQDRHQPPRRLPHLELHRVQLRDPVAGIDQVWLNYGSKF